MPTLQSAQIRDQCLDRTRLIELERDRERFCPFVEATQRSTLAHEPNRILLRRNQAKTVRVGISEEAFRLGCRVAVVVAEVHRFLDLRANLDEALVELLGPANAGEGE